MKKYIILSIVALLLGGMLLAPVDQCTAYADSDTDTDTGDTANETDQDDELDTDTGDAADETDRDDKLDSDTEDATEEIDEDDGWESDEEEDEEGDNAQDDKAEASNASIITGPTIGTILLIHDNSVSGEDVKQMKDSASDLGIYVVDKRIDFDLKYSGLDIDDMGSVNYIMAISRDVSGLDILINYVASEKLPLNGKEVIVSSTVDKQVLEQHSLVLQKKASPDLIIVTHLKDSDPVWDATLSSLAQKRPVTEVLHEKDVEFSTVDDHDIDEIPAYREAVTDTMIIVAESKVQLETLKLLLLLPFAATIVAIFRNVIGVRMYGVFGPAIMSIAFLSSGLIVGLALFAILLTTGIIARRILERLNLMMVPRLAVLLTMCCIVMATVVSIGIKMDNQYLARLTVFPLIITAMIIENFMRTTAEKGLSDALKICFSTVIVSAACFLVISIPTLQAIVMTHPEILLLVMGLNILIGRWKGLRLVEYFRFSKLMKG